MNKLAQNIKNSLSKPVPRTVCVEMIRAMYKIIKNEMSEGRPFAIFGLGSITPYVRKERLGINPHTKQKMTIKTANTIKFKISKRLFKLLNQSK